MSFSYFKHFNLIRYFISKPVKITELPNVGRMIAKQALSNNLHNRIYTNANNLKHVFMNNWILLLAGGSLLTACGSTPDADKANATEEKVAVIGTGQTFTLDTASSSVQWTGAKQTGEHFGTFKLTEGRFLVNDGSLTSGEFNIAVSSLEVLDQKGEQKTKLENHLKGADFFETEKFPGAIFSITGVEPFDSAQHPSKLEGTTHIISGNLTMKDQTKNISFPAVVLIEGNRVAAKADFNIDRTEWGLNYKGADNPQDWFIKKEVNLKLDINASEK